MVKKFNFTKKDIDALPLPVKGFETYFDTKEKGLKLSKAFINKQTTKFNRITKRN